MFESHVVNEQGAKEITEFKNTIFWYPRGIAKVTGYVNWSW